MYYSSRQSDLAKAISCVPVGYGENIEKSVKRLNRKCANIKFEKFPYKNDSTLFLFSGHYSDIDSLASVLGEDSIPLIRG